MAVNDSEHVLRIGSGIGVIFISSVFFWGAGGIVAEW